MQTLRPRRLQPGDTVAVISPSAGLPSSFPLVYENGLRNLEKLGLRIKEFPTARAERAYLAQHPEARAADVNAAFADPDIAAVITSIGGSDSIRILPFLDRETIIANPKILMGFSDITTLHAVLNQWGLVTVHGPTVMASLAQLESLPEQYAEHLREMLFTVGDSYRYRAYADVHTGYPDFSVAENVGKANPAEAAPELRWVQGTGTHRGTLFGGCFEILEMLKGTPFWPEPEFFTGTVLVVETSEDVPTLEQVLYAFRSYAAAGIVDRLAGLLFATPYGYSETQRQTLEDIITTVITEECGRADLPIVMNVPFGHTDPKLLLPLGSTIEIDCDARALRLDACPWSTDRAH
jgi:muramoyltetrapeptide carboxypeptidase LdcA involved in peptidoglycan recycling